MEGQQHTLGNSGDRDTVVQNQQVTRVQNQVLEPNVEFYDREFPMLQRDEN